MEQQAQQAAIEQANIAARVERRGILQQEVAKVERCDGSDPSLVLCWLKEIQLSAPHLNTDNEMLVELAASTAGGAFRAELENFQNQNQNLFLPSTCKWVRKKKQRV